MQNTSSLISYSTKDGNISFKVNVFDETIWLTQEQMAQLFGKSRTTITEHIRNIFKEKELEEKVVCRNFRHATRHGAVKGREQVVVVKYYNLDVIISVGYRIIPNPNYKILFMLHIFGINFNQKSICISLYISLFD